MMGASYALRAGVPARPWNGHTVLDTYGCQGGAAMGYWLAGFDVLGVDIVPQPRYPFAFVQADAVEFIATRGGEFSAIHGSPPCQRYSLTQRIRGNEHPDLIGPTREAMRSTGRPYVIENVVEAAPELLDPVELCGAPFGLHTYRHRLFEAGGGLVLPQPDHPAHAARNIKMGRRLAPGDWYHAVGNFSGVDYARRDMGVYWMNRDGIRECIPPVYSRWVGGHLAALLGLGVAA